MWVQVTEQALLTRISGAELNGFRSAALASGQADPIAPVIAQVTETVRGYIAGCRQNVLGPEGTIPEKLVGPTVDLIVIEVEKRAGGTLIDPQGARQSAAREAMSILRDVAGCRFVIEAPEEKTEEKQMVPKPTIKARKPRFREQRGI